MRIPLLGLAAAWLSFAPLHAQSFGMFESHADVGANPTHGSAEYNTNSAAYSITGSGQNMWADKDAFHFVWMKVSGDMALTADVELLGDGVEEHRKAGLIVRQSLAEDSAYADAVVHGSGLTSLQFRRKAHAQTEEVQSEAKRPRRIRLERRGDQFLMYVGEPGGELVGVQAATVKLSDPVYVGLAVCAHNEGVLETAKFTNVRLEQGALSPPEVRTQVRVYDLASKTTETVLSADQHIEAPNWSPDGKRLLVNSGGDLYWLPLDGDRRLEKITLSKAVRVNNDHGISPDGKMLALSGSEPGQRGSQIYTAAIDGSGVKKITTIAPSYFHGFSPDGKWLGYTAQRNGDYDLHRIPAAGGKEERLNRAKGLDDGPDYSPDGKWIYTNSIRDGDFDIWRIPADGAGPDDAKAQQITNDAMEDWFPHPSPDGKWISMIAFEAATEGHPPNRNVVLRLMPTPGDAAPQQPAEPVTVVKLFGGQGTMNVNSWSPDSKKFAFVSYELVSH